MFKFKQKKSKNLNKKNLKISNRNHFTSQSKCCYYHFLLVNHIITVTNQVLICIPGLFLFVKIKQAINSFIVTDFIIFCFITFTLIIFSFISFALIIVDLNLINLIDFFISLINFCVYFSYLIFTDNYFYYLF